MDRASSYIVSPMVLPAFPEQSISCGPLFFWRTPDCITYFFGALLIASYFLCSKQTQQTHKIALPTMVKNWCPDMYRATLQRTSHDNTVKPSVDNCNNVVVKSVSVAHLGDAFHRGNIIAIKKIID